MINKKPKNFAIVYESGVSGEFADPRTGIAWYRLKWPALKASLQTLAERAHEPVTIINTANGDTLTVTPEGKWS